MNVLVVDDQINVVNGICKGINWKSIGIRQVFKAYHVRGAKEIIQTQRVDILLCDIEMPEENGLELYQWVRENNYSLKCIFLTAHADFDYAKTAVSLGGFDYILQPARYLDIEKSLLRAMAQIKEEQDTQKYSNYGKIFFKEREVLLDHLFYGWFCDPGQTQYAEKITDTLKKLGILIQKDEMITLLFIQVFGWHKGNWEDSLVRYAVKNILEELFDNWGKKVFLNIIPDYGYLLFCYGGQYIESQDLNEAITHFFSVSSKFFEWSCALYIKENSRISQMGQDLSHIRQYLVNNVAQQEGIFYLEENWGTEKQMTVKEPDYNEWEQLLVRGCGKRVYEEATEYLDGIIGISSDSAMILRRFYDNFMKTLYLAEARAKISHEEIISGTQDQQLSIHAYETVESMKKLVHLASVSFAMEEESSSAVEKQIERIKEYIYQNLDKDLRREEIAMEVFINPNYLSRMFKKEVGISLKEFIVGEKMKMAKMLLQSSSLSVSIVALKVGYTNFSHFSQVYRKYYGIRPTDEKKENERKK